ncbi:MAG: hypothetical protein J2P44_00165 [Candidatus Dormibacteraeota bacterium]|nr:hypothetical protein [Candidatus Dormibacteraeota bacterium]
MWADRNYMVPPGGGTIPDFSFQSTSDNQGQRLAFLVLRPEGGTSYMVVGTTGVETLAGSGVETFKAANIPVQAGDILGYWVPSGQNFLSNCLQDVGSGGGAVQSLAQPSEPNVGDTLSLPNAASTFDLNVSATLVPPPPAAVTAFAVQGIDGQLWAQAPQLPSGWQPLGGRIIAAPAVAAVPQSSGLASPLFIATAPDHSLWVRSLNDDWAPLTHGLNTFCFDNPAAVVRQAATGPMLTVACQGRDHALYSARVPVPASGLPQVTAWTDLGGFITDGPAVAPVNGMTTYFANSPFFNGEVWMRTDSTGWEANHHGWACVGHPAAGIAQGGTTTWFGCRGLDGQLWAGPLENGVVPQGGAVAPGVGLGITSAADFMFVEGSFGPPSVWFRTATAGFVDLGGLAVGGVGAVGLG